GWSASADSGADVCAMAEDENAATAAGSRSRAVLRSVGIPPRGGIGLACVFMVRYRACADGCEHGRPREEPRGPRDGSGVSLRGRKPDSRKGNQPANTCSNPRLITGSQSGSDWHPSNSARSILSSTVKSAAGPPQPTEANLAPDNSRHCLCPSGIHKERQAFLLARSGTDGRAACDHVRV